MTPKDVKEVIQNYCFYLNDYKEMSNTVNGNNDDFFDLMGVGLSSREEKLARRLEELERRLMTVLKAFEETELTEKEWVIVNWLLDGRTITQIGRILCISHTHTARQFYSAAEKISNYINEAQAS